MDTRWLARLPQACPEVAVRYDEPLAEHVSFRVGGPAAAMAFPADVAQLRALLAFCREEGLTPRLLGAGTNVLPPDEGVDTLVICLLGGLTALRREGDELVVGAGVPMARAAVFACEAGLTGLEFAHGIPGSMGGGICMNAGAYGGELCQVAVETAALRGGRVETVRGGAQGFGYRTSAFQDGTSVVVETRLRLAPGDPAAIRARMQELSARRRASQPLNLPSAGSTFKRPAGGYAAALIDGAGLKGLRVGGASVSEKHAGFVVNDGGATCADILALIAEIRRRVYDDSGILLEPEVRIW